MSFVSKISSTENPPLGRRFPEAFEVLDLNFCRNPAYENYDMHPDPFKRPGEKPPAPPAALRGEVSSKKHEEFFRCPTCNKTSRIKNNRAIAEKYQRLKHLQEHDPAVPSCKTPGCFAQGMAPEAHPEFYRRFGKTVNADPRFQCRLCSKTGPAPVSFRSGAHVKRPFVRMPRGFSSPRLSVCGAGCRSH
ncbi:hypothetical protein [Phaeovulum sp.]|uniref:hypothetical protein n=1 Tax=Phaeovulum sp. TaxID=2934796 RepID=UPI0039E65056